MTDWCSALCAGAILRAPIGMMKSEENGGSRGRNRGMPLADDGKGFSLCPHPTSGM